MTDVSAVQSGAPECVIVVPDRVTINEAEAWQGALVAHLAESDALVLDCANVEAVDLAGLQLMVSLRRSARKLGKSVRLAAPPEGALLAAVIAAGFRKAEDEETPPANGWDVFWRGRT